MNSIKKSIFCLFFAFPVMALGHDHPATERASFEGVTSFEANEISGRLLIRCSGGKSRWEFCRGSMLNPTGGFAFFEFDGNVDAEKVEIRSTWENGRKVRKRYKWNREKERTSERVNLWINTLFQKPLLNYGNNDVVYAFKANNDSVIAGGFTAYVAEGDDLQCPDDSLFSSNPDDCERGNLNLCQDYFRNNNYCN